MKKFLSIICCIAMLCSISVLTASADTESDRMHEAFIYNAKNETEAYFIYDDFDGNGSYEAFGITGNKTDEGDFPNANIYFINNDMSVTKVNEKAYGGTLSLFDSNNVLSAGSSKFVVWDENYRGPGSTAHIYGVKNGSLYEPKVSGEYSGIKPDGDAFILGKSVSQGVTRYDEYRFKFDDSSKEFVADDGSAVVVESDTDKNTDNPTVYTAQTLKTKTLPEIVDIMGGNFQYGPVYVGDSQTSSLAIGNPETLKGYEFIVHGITYRDFEKNWSAEIENIKAGKYTYDYIYVGSVGALDDKVTGDMTYNDLTAVYGDFDCIVAGGKGNVCYSVKADDGSNYATIIFDKSGLSLSDTSSKAMKAANSKIETIIVPVNATMLNSDTEIPDNNDTTANNTNSNDNSNNGGNTNNNSTIKSPATSTLGADSTMPLFGIAGVLLIAIVGCISSIAVYRRRKETL